MTVLLRSLIALGALLGLALATAVHAAPPSGLNARLTGGGSSVTLTWDRAANPAAPTYVIQRGVTELRCQGDGCSAALPAYTEYARVPGRGSGATVEFPDATPVLARINCYRVYLAGESPPDESVTGQCLSVPAPPTDAVTLAAPSGLGATIAPGFRSIALSWPAAAEIRDGYIVERSITGSADSPRAWLKITPTPVFGDPASGDASHEDRFVTEPGWYCYRVRANSLTALGPPSDEVCVARTVADGPSLVVAPLPPATGTGPGRAGPGAGGVAVALAVLGIAGLAATHRRARS